MASRVQQGLLAWLRACPNRPLAMLLIPLSLLSKSCTTKPLSGMVHDGWEKSAFETLTPFQQKPASHVHQAFATEMFDQNELFRSFLLRENNLEPNKRRFLELFRTF